MPGKGRQFSEGQSGNPAGRPKDARNRTTVAMEGILEGEAEGITRRAIELARDGDTVALRFCMDRLLPVRKDRPVRFEMPPIETIEDLAKATDALLRAVAAGDLTPSETADVGRAVDAHVKAIETTDIHQRLARLEEGTPR